MTRPRQYQTEKVKVIAKTSIFIENLPLKLENPENHGFRKIFFPTQQFRSRK